MLKVNLIQTNNVHNDHLALRLYNPACMPLKCAFHINTTSKLCNDLHKVNFLSTICLRNRNHKLYTIIKYTNLEKLEGNHYFNNSITKQVFECGIFVL